MKSGFQTALCTELKDKCDNIWIVTKPLKYWSAILDLLIIVPPWFETVTEVGPDMLFETDLASVPRVPIIYDLWGNRAHREAVLHDWLYRIDSVPVVSKSQADRVFLEAMGSTGKPWYIRHIMYMGVVLGGGSSYHKKCVKDKL